VALVVVLLVVQSARQAARRALVDSYEEQGRELFLAHDAMRAMVYLDAARKGDDSSPSLRFLLARAAAVVELQRASMTHGDRVFSAHFSPDGSSLVTASEDGTAKLWDAQGALRATLGGHGGAVAQARFSPDGKRVVTASWDGKVRLFDATTGA